MTFAPRFERPATFARMSGRAMTTPRIQDAPEVNKPAAAPLAFPGPVAGLKLFDDVGAIPDGGALVLNNWVVQSDVTRARAGSEQRNTGLGGEVRALMTYTAGATQRLFAVANGNMFDASAPGAVGAAMVTGLAAANWSSVQFATAGGVFLIAAALGNTRRIYDGTSWATTPAITGVTATNLSQVWSHANRLFFVESGTLNAWYLAVDAVGGVATRWPLGGIFNLGGSLVAGATWTNDAGSSGLRSTCVFISSEGEVAVYDGADPVSWTLQGVYRVAKPLGINCFMKTGGDLAILTEDGMFAMSQVISLDRAALINQSVSKDVRPIWRAYVAATDKARWQITRRDAAGYAIVSFPGTPQTPAIQLVANLQSGAWSTFSGWSPTCMAAFGDDLVFGTADGRIIWGERGGSDLGAPYTMSYIGPYRRSPDGSAFGAKMMRATLRVAGTGSAQVAALFDYVNRLPNAPSVSLASVNAKWNSGVKWNSGAKWGGGKRTIRSWQSVSGFGSAVAPCVQYTVSQIAAPLIDLVSTDLQVEGAEVVA